MFKILALDGGGIKGTFTASVLAEIERRTKKSLLNHFDLIVGTSTGGIIAIGICFGFRPERILQIYRTQGPAIFPKAWIPFVEVLKRIFSPSADDEALADAVRFVFGERPFRGARRPIAITAFNAVTGEPAVFKARYPKPFDRFDDASIVDIALATSSAPTYFSAAKNGLGVMIDGGVWANCPAMVGIVDALTVFNQRPRDIAVLSIGTTHQPFFIDTPKQRGGLLEWAAEAPTLLMHATKLGTISKARKLSGYFLRIDETVEPGRFKMDDAKSIADLEQLGKDAATKEMEKVSEMFLAERAPTRRWPSRSSKSPPSKTASKKPQRKLYPAKRSSAAKKPRKRAKARTTVVRRTKKR